MARFEVLEITVSNVPNARELVLHLANEYSLVFECIDDRQFYTIRMYSVRLDQIDKVLQYRRVNYHLLVVSDDELHLTVQSINGNPVLSTYNSCLPIIPSWITLVHTQT